MCCQRVFSEHSLLPCLQILSSSTAHGRRNIVDALQELVMHHAILPARASQLIEANSNDSQSSDRPANLMDELLASILTETPVEPDRNYQVLSIKALFQIAVRVAPPRSPKERRLETSWLQKLFTHITEHLSFFDSGSASVGQRDSSCALVQGMLRAAVDQGFRFDRLVLERIVHRLFEGFQRTHDSFWGIISACMEMDANIFVSRSRSSDHSSEVSPNQLLYSLFDNIRKHHEDQIRDRSSSGAVQTTTMVERSAILNHVIFPLAQAFADARDFNDFLGYWQSQLAIVLQGCNHWGATIWEDEELLQLIRGLAEPSLTIGQIEQVFLSTCNMLSSMIAQNVDEATDVAPCMAMMIVLESIVSGCTTDMSLQKLKHAAFAFQKLCFSTDFPKFTRSKTFKSRLWRLFATLNNRWPLPTDHLDPIMHTAIIAVEAVLENVEEPVVDTKRTTTQEAPSAWQAYSEKVQALRFILSLASTEKGSQYQSAGNSIIAPMSVWVEKILNWVTLSSDGGIESKTQCWDPLSWEIQNEPETPQDPVNPSWEIRNDPSNPAEFAIATLVLIVHSPSVLR